MGEKLGVIVLALAVGFFGLKRLLQYLRFFQQEEYNPARFLLWIRAKKAFDTKGTSVLALLLLLLLFVSSAGMLGFLLSVLAAGAMLGVVMLEQDPRSVGKIRLNMTERAGWIYKVAFGLYAAAIVLALILVVSLFCETYPLLVFTVLLIAIVQATPFFLSAAVRLLAPAEQRKQDGLLHEAKTKMLAVAPYTIGITGSYGKTSTKAILGTMLDTALAPTFWPQKGINTPMGITREIREKLTSAHRYAVVEMGAYHIGSIKRLCNLTPPNAALITAVGLMHLDRFGGAENIYRAKSELAQAIPSDGLLVVNGDNAGARRMGEEFPSGRTIRYGLNPDIGPLEYVLHDISFSPEGSTFSISWDDRTVTGFTALHGRPALSNILGSFAVAITLGADPDYLIGVIRNLTPVSNRLEVTRVGEGLQINDAYNSNPQGFRAALEVLEALPGDRRIMMTPGMIELGEEQDTENEAIAALAARVCTDVLIIGDENRASLVRGLEKSGFPMDRCILCKNRTEGFSKLAAVRGPRDVVLLENDLPDLFEMDIRF